MKRFILVFLLCLMSMLTKAQPEECTESSHPCYAECNADCGGPTCMACLDALEIPIDGGIVWLLLGGAGIGIRRLVVSKKSNKKEID
jgi:hypothetical protein